jgi:hypothetical protein
MDHDDFVPEIISLVHTPDVYSAVGDYTDFVWSIVFDQDLVSSSEVQLWTLWNRIHPTVRMAIELDRLTVTARFAPDNVLAGSFFDRVTPRRCFTGTTVAN